MPGISFLFPFSLYFQITMKQNNISKKEVCLSAARDIKLYYSRDKQKIKQRLKDFQRIVPTDYFYELVYCLLTPQSSAVNAGQAVNLLRQNSFSIRKLNPERFLYNKDLYIRFHKNKSKYLLEMKEQYTAIYHQLKNGLSAYELREWLVKNVKGLGYKEASHFLRNIGYRNLAILDRHILRNLVRAGVLKQIPKSISRFNYLETEKEFLDYSKKIKIPMDELDLLFWSMETGEILK
jgi:N-glycosylase/DNA lyase